MKICLRNIPKNEMKIDLRNVFKNEMKIGLRNVFKNEMKNSFNPKARAKNDIKIFQYKGFIERGRTTSRATLRIRYLL